MGCTSEKSIPELNRNKKALITDSNIELDLNDIEKQGESKHPQRVIINDNKIEEEKNYYNYNLNDLILVNKTKMTVKRIENFDDDDDDDDSESEEDNKNLENKEEENNEDDNENKEVDNFEQNEDLKENKNNNINEIGDDGDKKPEDKKPPNIEKLKKKGKEKKEISIF